jgi:hypothetical protein
MITLKDWMEAVNHRITEGSDYGWTCYGADAYSLDSWDGDQDGVSSSIIFDTRDQTVYEVNVYDYSKNRAYRLINPDYRDAHEDEADERGSDSNCAWDDVNYTDLETDEDMLAKLTAIMNYEEFDERISVPVDIPDDELFTFMKMAHERDITLNQFVEEALRHAIAEAERDPEGMKRKAKEFRNEKRMA